MDDAAKIIARLTDEIDILRQRNAELEAVNAQQQQISDALHLSEARFRLLFEQSPLSTQLLDPNGWTAQVNHAWTALWGMTLEQVRDYNMLHDAQLEAKGIMPYIQRAFAGEAVDIPPILYDPNETLPDRSQYASPQRWVSAFMYPVMDQDGQVREVVLIHQDISERESAEQAVRASEARYRTLVENFPNGSVFLFDSELRYMLASGAGLAASGLSPGMFEGKTIWEVFPQEIAARDEPALRAALCGKTTRVEVPFGDNTYFVQTLPVTDAAGAIVGGMVMTQDISDRKRAEQRLRFQAEASAILGASLDSDTILQNIAHLAVPLLGDVCAIFIVEPNGAINPVAVGHVDPVSEDHLRERQQTLMSDADEAHPVVKTIRTGRITSSVGNEDSSASSVRQDASSSTVASGLLPASHLIMPLTLREQVLGAIAFGWSDPSREASPVDFELAKDLANRVAQALEHSQLYRQAQEALRARDEFLSIAAHELKTPLTGLRGYAEVLLRARTDAQPAARSDRELRMLQVIVQQSERLQQQIDTLLDLSQIGANQLSLDLRPLDVCSLVERIVDEIQPTLDHHQILVTCAPAELLVQGDAGRLQQVLQNLIQNAVKYSPHGGTINVQVTRQESEVAIKVIDQGIGIPVEAQARLFERFYRVRTAASEGISGLGIGLAVVSDIVARHGGRVEVESVEGAGSAFTVWLPEFSARSVPEGAIKTQFQ